MNVYRYLKEKEVKAFQSGDLSGIGFTFEKGTTNLSNTHKYKDNVTYLHFFKNLDDLKSIRQLYRNEESDCYIGVFDIPFITLYKHAGVGFYETSGYDIDYDTVREFAIPVEDVRPDYLKGCMKDEDRSILYDKQTLSENIVMLDNLTPEE